MENDMNQDAASIEKALRDKGLGDYVAGKLREGQERMDKLGSDVETLKDKVTSIEEDIKVIREVLLAGKGFFKTAGWIVAAFKWVGGVAVAALALFGLWEKFK